MNKVMLSQKKRELELGAARLKFEISAAEEKLADLDSSYQQQIGAISALNMLIAELGQPEEENVAQSGSVAPKREAGVLLED